MSATSTFSSPLDALLVVEGGGDRLVLELRPRESRRRCAAVRSARLGLGVALGSSSTKNTGRPSTARRDRRAGLRPRRGASGAPGRPATTSR